MSRILNAPRQSAGETASKVLPPTDKVLTQPASTSLDGLSSVSSIEPSIAQQSRVEALTHPNEFAAEQFRMLGARLRHLAETRLLKMLLVTSASFREGKSLVSLNLAITLAQRAGKKVLLVEADLRKPALCQMLGLPPLCGLSDWVQSDEPLTNFLRRVTDLNLWLLPAGESCAEPLSIIESLRLHDLPTQAGRQFDWIVIDSPPLLVTDASILSRMADGTLVVVRQECTQKKSLQKTLASLERVLGFVLNDATSVDPHGYYHYYTPPQNRGKRRHAKASVREAPASAGSNGGNAIAS
ncbi:MAG: CpsD/CapB family tyrosine-protein kinase [Candidatus Sulfotelmatobacter sp.]